MLSLNEICIHCNHPVAVLEIEYLPVESSTGAVAKLKSPPCDVANGRLVGLHIADLHSRARWNRVSWLLACHSRIVQNDDDTMGQLEFQPVQQWNAR